MILPFEKRPNLKDIINEFIQLKNRYELLLSRNYKKSCEIIKVKNDINNKILNLRSAPSTDIL